MGNSQINPAKTTGQKFASAGAWSTSGKLVSKVIDLATLVVLTNLLDPADFGLVAKAMVVILVIEAVTTIPIEAPILRLNDPKDDVYHTAFTLTIARAAIIFALIVVLAKPLSAYYQDPRLVPLLIVLASAPALRGCASPRMAAFVRSYNMKPEFVIDIASKLISLLVGTTVAVLTKSYWAIAVCTVTTTAILAVLSYYFAPYRPRISFRSWREFSDIVTWNTASLVFQTMSWQYDQFLLGRFLETKIFGQYSISRTLVQIPEQTINLPIRRPMLTAFTNTTDNTRRNELWLIFSAGTLICVGPLFVLLAAQSQDIGYAILGPGWESAALFISGLAIASIPSLPTAPLDPLAISIYKTKLIAIRVILEFCISLPIMTFAILNYGAWGAIVSRGLIETGMTLYVFSLVRTHTGLHLKSQFLALWRPMVSLGALATLLLLLLQPSETDLEQGRISTFFEVLGISLLGLVFFLSVLLLLWAASGKPKSAEHHIWRILKDSFRSAVRS